MGGHPVAKWHGLYLWTLGQVLGPKASVRVALRGPLPLRMSQEAQQESLGVSVRATDTASLAAGISLS